MSIADKVFFLLVSVGVKYRGYENWIYYAILARVVVTNVKLLKNVAKIDVRSNSSSSSIYLFSKVKMLIFWLRMGK